METVKGKMVRKSRRHVTLCPGCGAGVILSKMQDRPDRLFDSSPKRAYALRVNTQKNGVTYTEAIPVEVYSLHICPSGPKKQALSEETAPERAVGL
jgi:ribosomal protein S27AE